MQHSTRCRRLALEIHWPHILRPEGWRDGQVVALGSLVICVEDIQASCRMEMFYSATDSLGPGK